MRERREGKHYLGGSFYDNGLDLCDGLIRYSINGPSRSPSFTNSPLQETAQGRRAQLPAESHGRCALNRILGVH